jgi:hypothetical protein
MKWIFDKYRDNPHAQIGDGYDTLDLINGEAEIDPKDKSLVALAEKFGGVVEAKEVKVKAEPTKKGGVSDAS